jgi:putative inorganic carbon (hco3(-)) transporter
MTAELARAGGPIAAVGLALLLVATRRDLRAAGLALWALGCVLIVPYLAPHGHRPLLFAAAVLGIGLAGAAAVLLRRWPWLIAVGALACVPARIPVHIGSTDANLLIPLYGVVASGALLLAWELFRGDERARELGPLALPLAALVAWSGLSLVWSDDLRKGAIALLAFWLPFGLLAISLARLTWDRRWANFLYAQLAAMAVVFAVIGVFQYVTRDVFWNPKVIVGNAYAPFYRVNSVFYDPSIYGRFLAVAILASLVLVMFRTNARVALVAAAAICATWVGLLFSFSQSSFVALFVGTAVVASFAWRWRAVAALGLVAAVVISVGFSAPNVRHSLLHNSGTGLNKASSGRFQLVTNGIKIWSDNPVQGCGIGCFTKAYAKRLHLKGKEPKTAASHDTPVTVAAETGIVGLGLLVWLVAAALVLAFRRAGLSFTRRACFLLGVLLAAIFVHSLFYNALFEDPMFWGLLGLVVIGARAVVREEESVT